MFTSLMRHWQTSAMTLSSRSITSRLGQPLSQQSTSPLPSHHDEHTDEGHDQCCCSEVTSGCDPTPQMPVVTYREVMLVPLPSTVTSTPPMDHLLYTLIFYPYEQINNYVCQVIVDIGGCDHATLESVLHLPGLSTVSHHLPDNQILRHQGQMIL